MLGWDASSGVTLKRVQPASPFALFYSCRKGEGAFRLQPREPELRPQPLDKYELRETKRRLQQGLDISQQSLMSPRACSHLSPLRPDPFCGEHAFGSLFLICLEEELHRSCWLAVVTFSVSSDFHSCLPAPMPAAC